MGPIKFAFGLLVVVLLASSTSAVCPPKCVCSTSPDGLHRAACSSLTELYKYTLRQKHHNINILDLSHNNITRLTHELDRLTEVVTLDLSTNGINNVDKFLNNAQKIVHLNLANNRLRKLSASALPKSISSLDLTNNLLVDVPSDLEHLKGLEHLELDENPLNCSCENIQSRDYLASKGVLIDHVKCASPSKYKGISWLNLKTNELCSKNKMKNNLLSMVDDEIIDTEKIGVLSNLLKKLPMQAVRDLDEGETWALSGATKEDEDEVLFLTAKRPPLEALSQVEETHEGSGDNEDNSIEPDSLDTTENPQDMEGSGEGSGFFPVMRQIEDENQTTEEFLEFTSTTEMMELIVPEIRKTIATSQEEVPPGIIPPSPTVYGGGSDWQNNTPDPSLSSPRLETDVTEEPLLKSSIHDTTVSQKIQVPIGSDDISEELSSQPQQVNTTKTGTYICIGIIVVLLVGLIGFAIIKGQMRKRRDRRLLRQQRRDVEKASKEMVDMNKSLLGKPANTSNPDEKKMNGRYELVPTHENQNKKGENGDITNKEKENNYNQNKSSPRDNNQNREIKPVVENKQQETNLDKAPNDPEAKKDASSLSSDDLFVPISDDTPHMNGITDSDASHPLVNGHNTDSDYLSPSREYVPVYSPDMGRVRIKMTETPKPKTPVLVTRSRSNAGDIIITPDVNVRKSTT